MELPPGHRVEAGSGLVEEQQLGPPDDADRDVEPPPLPAGQARDPPVRLGGEPDEVDQLGGVPRPGDLGRGVPRVVGAEVPQQLADPPLGMVPPGLQHDPEPRPPLLTAVLRVRAEHGHPPRRPRAEPFEYLDRGGLARTVRPEERDDFPGAYLEVDAVQDVRGPVPHPQVANFGCNIRHDVQKIADLLHLIKDLYSRTKAADSYPRTFCSGRRRAGSMTVPVLPRAGLYCPRSPPGARDPCLLPRRSSAPASLPPSPSQSGGRGAPFGSRRRG